METGKTSNSTNGSGNLNDQAIRNAAASAAGDIHGAINKASEIAIPAIDRLAASAHTAVDKISDVAAEVSDKIVVTGKQLRQTQERLLASSRRQVQQSPAASVMIAMVAGFLLCKLFQSRR